MKRKQMLRLFASVTGKAAALFCLVGPSAVQAGSYTFVTLDSPLGYPTYVTGINDSGLVSGLDINPSGLDAGLLFNGGVASRYMAPLPGGGTAISTDFWQVNNTGQVAADYSGSDNVLHAAVYNSMNSTWTYLPNVPGYANNAAFGINNAGLVVGGAYGSSGLSGGVGWVWNGSSYTFFQEPNAGPSGSTGGYAVNDAGTVVGSYYTGIPLNQPGNEYGFIMKNGVFTQLDVPGSFYTEADGINNSGVVVGQYYSLTDHSAHGFLYDNGIYTTVDVPGAEQYGGNVIFAINNLGDVAGLYYDANGNENGFVGYAVPEPSALVLLGIGLGGVLLSHHRRVSNMLITK